MAKTTRDVEGMDWLFDLARIMEGYKNPRLKAWPAGDDRETLEPVEITPERVRYLSAEIRRLRSELEVANEECLTLSEVAEANLRRANRAEAELERRDAALREARTLVEEVHVGNERGPSHRSALVPKDWLDRARALATGGDDEA